MRSPEEARATTSPRSPKASTSTSEDLKSVWSGLDPRTSDQLGRFANRTVSGFDLCWRAPKSVSLMFAFGDPEIFGAPEPELDLTHAPQPDNRQPAELVRDALHRDASKELAVESADPLRRRGRVRCRRRRRPTSRVLRRLLGRPLDPTRSLVARSVTPSFHRSTGHLQAPDTCSSPGRAGSARQRSRRPPRWPWRMRVSECWLSAPTRPRTSTTSSPPQ
ncbi:MAG: relaxase domain-containing protein [Acidimicrobiales bacterium]